MHGGVIGAISEGEGKGCTFFLEIPCQVRQRAESNDRDSLEDERGADGSEASKSYEEDCEWTEWSARSRADTTLADYALVTRNVTTGEPVSGQHHRQPSKDLRQSGDITGLKVLLVDDSALARKMVERMLTDAGFHCHHACNGLQAVEKVTAAQQAGEQPFDVVLMDCYMPVMNGPEAVQLIRGDQCGYKGVVLAVTGSDADNSGFLPLLGPGGVDRIVMKPFQFVTFRTTLSGKPYLSKGYFEVHHMIVFPLWYRVGQRQCKVTEVFAHRGLKGVSDWSGRRRRNLGESSSLVG